MKPETREIFVHPDDPARALDIAVTDDHGTKLALVASLSLADMEARHPGFRLVQEPNYWRMHDDACRTPHADIIARITDQAAALFTAKVTP